MTERHISGNHIGSTVFPTQPRSRCIYWCCKPIGEYRYVRGTFRSRVFISTGKLSQRAIRAISIDIVHACLCSYNYMENLSSWQRSHDSGKLHHQMLRSRVVECHMTWRQCRWSIFPYRRRQTDKHREREKKKKESEIESKTAGGRDGEATQYQEQINERCWI